MITGKLLIMDNQFLAMSDITVSILSSYEDYYFASYCNIWPLKLRILVDGITGNFHALTGIINNSMYTIEKPYLFTISYSKPDNCNNISTKKRYRHVW